MYKYTLYMTPAFFMLMRTLLFVILLLVKPIYAGDLLGLPGVPVPSNNPQTAGKIALGKQLFNDARFSADGTISCASCHQQTMAFTDGKKVAQGIHGLSGVRNSPTLLNAAYYSSFFHDGRAGSLEQQAIGPILNPLEHGMTSSQHIMQVVNDDEEYRTVFKHVFSLSEDAEINIGHLSQALASYQRTLVRGNSAFDQYYFGRDKSLLNESAARGLRIFRRKGNCANCHEISWDHALFTDNRFYNIGIGLKAMSHKIDELLLAIQAHKPVESVKLTAQQKSALGRFNVTAQRQDIGKFKTPTLRNIALTAPYMHDGSLATLHDVVEYYNKGGDKNRFLDAAIFPLHLSPQEKQDLVAFMRALTSSKIKQH